MTTPNLASGTFINGLPTGTIDNLQALLVLEKGQPSSPLTIQSSLLQVAQFFQTNGLFLTGTYNASPAYIDGLDIDYNASGSITVRPGSAFVPSLGRNVYVTGAITQSIPIVAAPTTSGSWQNVYLGESGGIPFIQVTGTTASNPYSGVARTKSGDNSLRWIGGLLTDNTGYLVRFDSSTQGNMLKMNWIVVLSSTIYEPLTTGTSASPTATLRDISHLMPFSGAVNEVLAQIVLNFTAIGSDIAAGIGETIDIAASTPFQTAEMYVRGNTSLAATSLFFPPGYMKISGTTFRFISSIIAGSGSMSIRIKGIAIQR